MPLKPWQALLDDAGDETGDFEVLPATDYDVRVDKCEATMSSTGRLMFKMTLQVTQGPYKGRKLWDNMVVSHDNPVALGIFFRQMAALGIDRSFFSTNPSDAQVAEALDGREVRVQVGIRTWQGQERNEVKNYFPYSKTSESPAPPPPPQVPRAANPAPAPARPSTPQVTATQRESAAVTPPAAPAAPPQAEQQAAAEQPEVPDVPDTAPTAASSELPPPPPPPAGAPF